MFRRIVTPNDESKQEETFFTKTVKILRLEKMKRTTTEILIEIEETVQVWKTKQPVTVEGKTDVAVIDTIVCPFCGAEVSPAENLENQNKLENQKVEE
jgi:hypothetical protein